MKTTSLIRRAVAVGAPVLTMLAAPAAMAQVIPTTGGSGGNPGNAINNIGSQVQTVGSNTGLGGSNNLGVLVGRLINSALGLLGIVLVVIVIYAGFLWMTAQGNDEKVKQAKKMITNAVVGLVLIFAAYAITTFVVNALGAATQA